MRHRCCLPCSCVAGHREWVETRAGQCGVLADGGQSIESGPGAIADPARSRPMVRPTLHSSPGCIHNLCWWALTHGPVSDVPGTKSRWRASGYCSRATVSRTTRPTIWRTSCACSLLHPRSNLLHRLRTRNPVNDPIARRRNLRSVRFRFPWPVASESHTS